MKLYDSHGPNPGTVRLFIAERDHTFNIEAQAVNIAQMENRGEAYTSEVNARGELPALRLDNGEVLTEITAICEYLDELAPKEGTLIGKTPEERAMVRMWTRRVFLEICNPMTESWRNTQPAYEFYQGHREMHAAMEVPLKNLTLKNLKRLDAEMKGKSFIAGSSISLADLMLFSFVAQMSRACEWVKIDQYDNLNTWFQSMGARDSAKYLGQIYETGQIV